MKNSDKLKRYSMFIAGVIFSALGISLITKAGLGTSPITSLAFVLTIIFPHSLGEFTMLVNTVMFLIQAALLGKAFWKDTAASASGRPAVSRLHRRMDVYSGVLEDGKLCGAGAHAAAGLRVPGAGYCL
mgnify:CR=1 FL=1